MPFATFSEILKIADDNRFAVAAVNIFNAESAVWVVKAAERERLPVILMLYPERESIVPMSVTAAIIRALAAQSEVPVSAHLDHSSTFDLAISAIPAGFNSTMFDGSSLPYDENAAITKQVVNVARLFKVGVEAELGHVGSNDKTGELYNKDLYTNPDDAVKFVEHTGIDALGVAIGTSHGVYYSEPNLDIARLDEINKKVSTPLVLHGGSGTPREQLSEAVRHGINKVNIGTEFMAKSKKAVGKYISDNNYIMDNMEKAGEEVIELMRDRMNILNPFGYRLP